MPDTWSRIYTLPFTTIPHQVVTEGTDIFFEFPNTDPRSIYKYDVALNTHSKLVDSSAFAEVVTPLRFSMIVFKSNIYCSITDGFSIGNSDPYVRIYRINPSTGAVTLVNDTFPQSIHTENPAGSIGSAFAKMYSTESHLVCAYYEDPNDALGPAEFISQYSTNGTSWTTTTNSFSEVIELVGAADSGAQGRDYRILGIHDRFPVGSTNVVFLKFDAGTWSKVRGPVAGAGNSLWEVAADFFWTRDDFGEYTSDWVTFPTPTGLSGRMLGLNMPWAVCQDFADVDHVIYKINTASPPNLTEDSRIVGTGLTVTGNPIDVMIRLNDGNTLGFFKSFDASFPNWSIWQRSADLPATPKAWGGGGPPRPDELRYIGMDADNETLYVTSLQQPAGGGDNLWTLFRINLDTLIAAGSETFGSGIFGNIDLLNAGIYPVAKPGTDNVLFLRGRDGSDIKVQKADYNSTSAWSDIGEASPTWGVTDFMVSLQPDHFNASDMMAFFKSGSVYRTVTEGGSGSWTKQSTAPHGLRVAARHPNEPKRAIVAASGAGSMFYSHNLGASFAGASGSALGLVDAIEWDL